MPSWLSSVYIKVTVQSLTTLEFPLQVVGQPALGGFTAISLSFCRVQLFFSLILLLFTAGLTCSSSSL